MVLPALSPMASLRWSAVQSLLKTESPSSILEIGCGQGGFGARFAHRARYLGVEPDAQSFGVARERITPRGGTVLHGLVSVVPDDQKFDLVCAFEVLEHIDDDLEALRDWMNRLQPNGQILISVPAGPDRFGPMDTLVGHFRRYSAESLTSVMDEAGCVDIRTTLYGWPLGYGLESVRNVIARRTSTRQLTTMEERSAQSGRLLQPGGLAGHLVRWVLPTFALLQRAHAKSGTGLIAIGRFSNSPHDFN